MKRFLVLLLLIVSGNLFSQVGNEWINFQQKYYSFDVYRTGLYRIDQTALAASGIPVQSFAPQNIQVFGREREIPLFVADGNDNSFDPGDYILFFAERNDGWLDSLVYRDPSFIANPNYSLYNDTIRYFFTWSGSSNNKRFVPDNDVNFNAYTPVSFVISESSTQGVVTYSEGFIQGEASGSVYASGEGYSYNQAEASGGNQSTFAHNFNTQNLYTGAGAGNAELHFSAVANSNAIPVNGKNHHLRMTIGPSNLVLIDTTYLGYRHTKRTRSLPVSALNNGPTTLTFNIPADLGVTVDRQSLNYARLRFPKTPNMGGQPSDAFLIPFNSSASKSRVDLAGCPYANPLVFSFGATPRLHTAVNVSGLQQFIVANNAGGAPTNVIVTDLSQAMQVTAFRAVNGGTGFFTDFSQVNMEQAYLIIKNRKLETSTAQYAAYRSSVAGGSHNVITGDVDELYDQYGGGIPRHIMGVRRFAKHAYALAIEKPVALLLAGKGVREVEGTRMYPEAAAMSMIPAFGYPSSDVAITSGLGGTLWEPLIPTGRISANNDAELSEYLSKVIEYEAAQGPASPDVSSLNSDWQKQVLHFVGGSTAQQQQIFRNYMDNMADIISDTNFAANVTSYYKTSSDPLDPNVVSGVTEKISNGVSLMNFFSHAAVSNNGFEINIDAPENWNNQGKYPVVLGNSCYNGNIFSTDNGSMSEKSVLLPNEGAIAFISTVVLGYDYYLARYSTRLYEQMSRFSYAKTIGEQMKQAIYNLQALDYLAFPSDTANVRTFYESTASQMTLHGDPALRLNWHTHPEIDLRTENVYFTPSNLNLTVDTISMYIVLKNLGRSVRDTFDLTIRRNFPQSSTDSVYTIRIPGLDYRDTVIFRFPMQPNIGIGENVFTVQADLPSQVQEEVEEYSNNQVVKTLFIRVDGIQPIWPYEYAVVPIDSVTVKASTIDPILSSVKTYLFELDTTHFYNSPQLRKFSVTESGGVKQVHPSQWKNASGMPFPLVCGDSMVYFWRVALDSSVIVWKEFSFQYIKGKEGWGQDHFFQFKNNDFYGLQYNQADRKLEFPEPESHVVTVDAYNFESFYTAWFLDGEVVDYGVQQAVMPAGFYVFVIDPVTLEPWRTRYGSQNPNHGFGNANDNPAMNPAIGQGTNSDGYFTFSQNDPAQLSSMQNMLENEVPNGYYIGVYSSFSTEYETISSTNPSLVSLFSSLGATIMDSPADTMPFALMYRKGFAGSLNEAGWPSDPDANHVHFADTIYQSEYEGLETTPFIGPAFQWKTVYWKRDSLENVQADSLRLKIQAYDINKNLQLTLDRYFSADDSLPDLNSLLPAASYPYLRLSAYNSDKLYFTPGQIDRLHVLYSPVPEAAIDGTSGYYLSENVNNLPEGKNVSFAVDVKNVSAWDMDSLLISYYIEDASNTRHYLPYPRQDSLRSGETLRDTIQFSTLGLGGLNSLWMEVNPYISGSTVITDQLEQFHFNNLLQIPFSVIPDDEQPILDVTFNGMHILNNDIVSPKSEILITLKDENILQVMDSPSDTTLFGIYLTDPNGVQRRVPFMDQNGNIVMQWIPATAQNMKFKIVWPADFTLDGKYTLYVQGTDRSGNLSGDMEYRVTFEVVHESTISFMMNYPNPFSTSTRFVFTITGTEVPDDILIQIMTVTGRVVREISEEEIGRLNIGRNITQYAWDGKDEFGDQLANGVYLYHVKARINGEDIRHRETGADQYFKKEFGKMYLMR